MAATKKTKKTTQKSRKKTRRQTARSSPGDIQALEQLIENLLELHKWQHNLLRESTRRIKNLAAAGEKYSK